MINAQNYVSFLVFVKLVPPKFQSAVVKRALEFKPQATPSAQVSLNKYLDKASIPGFQRGSKAPLHKQLPIVLQLIIQSPELFNVVFIVWLESVPELSLAISEFIFNNQSVKPVSELSVFEKDDNPSEWSEDFALLMDQIGETVSQYEPFEIQLMLSHLIPIAIEKDATPPVVADNPESTTADKFSGGQEFRSIILGEWINTLAHLPETSDEWNEIESFVDAINQLAEQKRLSLINGRDAIKTVISNFSVAHSESLEFHGKTKIIQVLDTLQNGPLETLRYVAEALTRFETNLVNHKDLLEKPAKSVPERRAVSLRLEEIEQDIENVCTELETLSGEFNAESIPEVVLPIEFPPEDNESLAAESDLLAGKDMGSSVIPEEKETDEILPAELSDPKTLESPRMEKKKEVVIETLPSIEPQSPPIQIEIPNDKDEANDEAKTPGELPLEIDFSLDSAQMAAILLTEKDSPNFSEQAQNFIWQLLSEQKFSLAFHFTQSIEKCGNDSQLPSWLLRALICGRHIRFASGDLERQLSDDFAEFDENCFLKRQGSWNHGFRFLALAAALRPALLAPTTNARKILLALNFPKGLDSLYAFVQTITKFSDHNQLLDLSAIRKVNDVADWNRELLFLQTRFKNWREQAKAKSVAVSYKPARDVLQSWLRDDGLFGQVFLKLESVNMPAQEVNVLLTECRRLIDKLSLSDQIDEEISLTLSKLRHLGKDINSLALRRIYGTVHEFIELLNSWVILQQANAHHEKTYSQVQAEVLFDELRARRAMVESEITIFLETNPSPFVEIGAQLVLQTLSNLWQLFNPKSDDTFSKPSLKRLLNYELLKIAAPMDSDTNPLDPPRLLLERILRVGSQRNDNWATAFDSYCEERNHQFTGQIIDYLKTQDDTEINLTELAKKRQTYLQNCIDDLRADIKDTRNKIEAIGDLGLLKEKEQLELTSRLDGLESLLPKDLTPATLTYESLDRSILRFGERKKELAEWREQVSVQRNAERERVANNLRTSNLPKEGKAFQRITHLLETGDIWTAKECLELVERGEDLPESVITENAFLRFLPAKIDEIYHALEEGGSSLPKTVVKHLRTAAKNARHSYHHDVFSWEKVQGKQAEQSAELLEAWYNLKQSQQINDKYLGILFNCLGFNIHSVNSEKQGKHFLAKIKCDSLTDRDSCPSPHFGSEAKGNYRVLCVWNRPNPETLLTQVGETSRETAPTIVLYFSRMPARQRKDLARLCRLRHRSFIVLDESLLWFLSTEPSPRLLSFFETTLPFTFSEPYTTTAGRVPAEMFYGRKRERDSIIKPNGACFIYGGRQLGKTALLRNVQRFFHAPEKGQVALFFDIKYHGICQSKEIDEIWSLLAKEFAAIGIITRQKAGRIGAEKLLGALRDWLQADEQRRILLLLDEADDFLESDVGLSKQGDNDRLKQEFVRTTQLIGLMEETEGRFKVVFAGLHNVQRTTKLVNHKLAHLGDPICVGPLLVSGERREAHKLIEKPFMSLGYRFASTDLVTRIAWQTNHFPSLIQLYCQRLLQYLNENYKSAADTGLPSNIEAHHVEEAYNKDLRRDIRQRLILTLQLDQRYEVIGYAMALESLFERDEAQLRGYSVDWIRHQAVDYWEAGFRDSNSQENMRVLLDEMVGLGLLRTIDDDHYALRSENVATLIGTEKEIEDVLMRKREPRLIYEPATFRAAWKTGGRTDFKRRSPLTEQQSAALQQRSFDTSILYGTVAAGLNEVVPFLVNELGEDKVVFFDKIIDYGSFVKKLKAEINQRRVDLKSIVVGPECPWSCSWVASAQNQLGRLNSKENFVQVVFMADPQTDWNLFALECNELERLKGKNLKVINLSVWHDSVVRHWLEDCGIPLDEKDRAAIKQVTGNWSNLLHLFDEQMQVKNTTWQKALNEVQLLLKDSIAESILTEFGLPADTLQRQLFSKMAGVFQSEDEITPGLINEFFPEIENSELETCFAWADSLGLIEISKAGWRFEPTVAALLQTTNKLSPTNHL